MVTRLCIRVLALLLCAAPLTAQSPDSVIRLVEQAVLPTVQITGEPVTGTPLADRMRELGVPAVSVAVIAGGKISWARAWGLADTESGRAATPATLFQAASISKPVAATAALTLVEEGRLALDTNVNRYLTSWQVPESPHAHGQPVTLRRLLTHTAGLTVHGFPGYARSATIPDVVGVLAGRGNTDSVVVDTTPGAIWRYSGGGYTVAQLLLTDVTGTPFATLMQQRVLGPMGMTLSTYEQPLPESRWAEAATAYRANGSPVEELWHVYPEQAAAGLWTTPSDLARWGLAILAAYDGTQGGVLSPAMAKQMLTPTLGRQGLGPAILEGGVGFGHGGANEGFRCFLGVLYDGRGAAVMTNSDAGGTLGNEILGTLAAAYGWPLFRPTQRTVAALPATFYAELAGTYRLEGPGSLVTVKLRDGRLFVSGPDIDPDELLPESENMLFARSDGTRLGIVRENGRIVALARGGVRAVRVR